MSSASQAVASESASAASVASSAPSLLGGGNGDGGSAVLTDDQILGISGDNGAPSTTESSAAPAAQPQPAAPDAIPAELSIDDFKPLFQANPKVNSLWDRYDNVQKLVTQFGTPADARKAAETIQMLGGVQHLESLAAKAADVDQTDAVFFGGQPAERKQLASEWYDGEGPHEFAITSKAIADQVNATLEVMEQRDRESYVTHLDTITRKALTLERFPDYMANLARAVQAGTGIDEAAKAVLQWAGRFGLDKAKNGQPSPDEQRLTQRQADLDKRDQSFQQQVRTNTLAEADTQLGTFVKGEIDKSLSELKVNGRPAFDPVKSKVALSRVAKEIQAHLDDALAKNPVFIAQGNSIAAKGFKGGAKEWFDMASRFAKLQLPVSMKAVVDEWTQGVISQANGAAARATASASRVDVGTGSAPGSQSKPGRLTSESIRAENAKRAKEGKLPMSDDEILNYA